MKVGDYVKFKTLSREIKIGKVIEIVEPDKESMKKYCVYDLDNNEVTVDDYVIKSSPNIIDLIEVGDYVNGEKVLEVLIDRNMSRIKTELSTFFNNEIKSIVTHEHFSQREYRIGEWLYERRHFKNN